MLDRIINVPAQSNGALSIDAVSAPAIEQYKDQANILMNDYFVAGKISEPAALKALEDIVVRYKEAQVETVGRHLAEAQNLIDAMPDQNAPRAVELRTKLQELVHQLANADDYIRHPAADDIWRNGVDLDAMNLEVSKLLVESGYGS
jgi:polyhydroxyalkanoate synthesis regulator phasin